MRGLATLAMLAAMALVSPTHAQEVNGKPSYLSWSVAEAERIGKAMRVAGRVGGAFDFRVVHTEHSFNYKLRATWLTKEVIQATARLIQLSERLTDSQTQQMVLDATESGDVVMMVEVDPREGSGVIPNDWAAFFGSLGNDRDVVRGTNTPALEKVKALRGVNRRDYSYEVFWVVFPLTTPEGASLFPSGVTQAALTVRISDKEGRVTFPIPTQLRSE